MIGTDYETYIDPDLCNFGEVIDGLKEGKQYTRMGWNGDHVISLQVPDKNSKMNKSYIYIETEMGDLCPFTASNTDILSIDWLEVTD